MGGLCLVFSMQDPAEVGRRKENPTTVVKRDKYLIGQTLNSDLRPELASRQGVLNRPVQSETSVSLYFKR